MEDLGLNMRVLVTGHDGYIGMRLIPLLIAAGHEVVGMDSFLYEECTFGESTVTIPVIRGDVRDATVEDLEGFDAVIHLAAISNDPVGDLNPETTIDLNHGGTVHVARMAKAAGIQRFLFSSSCSLYGAGGQDWLDENAAFHPITPYGESKLLSEQSLSKLADDSFSPTYLRNATAYGVSARLRGDLVVNNLTAYAYLTGQVFLKSDGTPWRPLVHIEDISRAFVVLLGADRGLVHDEAFNVGRTAENYRIRDVGELVETVVPDSRVTYADDAGPDLRNYRVDCSKLEETFPDYQPVWTVRDGILELLEAYRNADLTAEDFHGPKLMRIRHVRQLIDDGRLDEMLRWRSPAEAASPAGGASR